MGKLAKIEPYIVQMQHKPQMAVALENVKIRDYEEAERNTRSFEIVKYLLDLLGVNAKGNEKQHQILIVHISQNYGAYTFEEIMLAFKYYVKGEYYQDGKPMLVINALNAVVFGRVMREFEFKKKRELDSYRRKKQQQMNKESELSKEDIYLKNVACLLIEFEYFKEHGSLPHQGAGAESSFDFLLKEKVITNNPENESYYKRKFIEDRNQLITEHELSFAKGTDDFKELKKLGEDLKNGMSPKIEIRRKRIILTEFYQKLVKDKIDLKDKIKT